MPDLLVKLYELPDAREHFKRLHGDGITVRTAMAYEKIQVIEWVQSNFGNAWASECDVAFSRQPISCLIATRKAQLVGFACYDSTMKNFFGPVGVAAHVRNHGIGTALLLRCLQAMAANGYAYAVIGGAGAVEFFKKTVNAFEIPWSSPGIYREGKIEGQSLNSE